ncbi:MAG: helix-turn-helix transcriptional regulator [Pseudomonadota bacterium]|nr:helix-turn-helix transcriptional regulator [Pseudomonadota bacterium]
MAEFLTTKEVAALLRIKERTVYDLVKEGSIPVSRVTGKLLFPRELVEFWVRRNAQTSGGIEAVTQPPPILAGSHDPLLDWAIRESGCGIATLFDGSLDGLTRVGEGKAIACGVHVYEPDREDWNVRNISRVLHGMPVVVVEWAIRSQGLILAPGNPKSIFGVSDVQGMKFIPRQKQAGSYVLLSHLLSAHGMDPMRLDMIDPPARSELDVALAVAEGKADVGLGIEAVARQQKLEFIELIRERYDIVVWRRDFFEPPLQSLLRFATSEGFRRRAEEMGGYEISGLGTVRLNGA